eukprot:scaffold10826_cov138-Skeletonema_marinoi.AAC.3
MLAAISDASSGHLRRCSGADSTNKSLSRETYASILSRPTNTTCLLTEEPATVSDASSGNLRRCSDADTTKKSSSRETDAFLLSWTTMLGH